MRIDERLGNAEFGGDVVERGAGEAARIEQLDGFLDDPLALVGQDLFAHATAADSLSRVRMVALARAEGKHTAW